LIHRDATLIATGHRIKHLWYIDSVSCMSDEACAKLKVTLPLWHQRLGHVNEKRLKTAIKKRLIVGVDVDKHDTDVAIPFCEACVQSKQTHKPFTGSADVQSKEILQLIHSDVCGPMSVGSLGGARYFVTFTDDYSRFSYVYFLKHKSEVFEKFKEFHAEVTNFTDNRIKTLRTDNGGEYTSFAFEQYLKMNGIRHEVTTPHTPQQNGISERLNRTLQEMAMSQILHAGLPKCFWADSIATACYVRNRLPVCPLNVSPFEKWYARKPSVKYFRVFGCVAYALKPDNERTKMDARSEKLRFIGYPLRAKGYRLYDEKKHRVIVRRDVIFNETVFDTNPVTYPSDVVSVSTPATDDNAAEQSEPQSHDEGDEAQSLPVSQPVRRSERQVRQPDRLGEWIEYIDTDVDFAQTTEYKHRLYFCNVVEPKTIDEAMKMPEAEMWKQASDEEMLAYSTMNT